MIRSMTGFGEASAQVDGVHYFVEIRSLNSRYFKATIRLPDEFQGLEAEIEPELRRRLRRGSVVYMARVSDVSEDAAHEINHQALSRYIEQIQKTPQAQHGDVTLDVGPLLDLPGVLIAPTNEGQRLDRVRRALAGLTPRACEGVVVMREREGKALQEDLEGQGRLIVERLALVRERTPAVSAEYERRLRTRIEQMMREASMVVQPVDLVKEIAAFVERADISEEITRLSSHMDAFRDLLGRDEPVGRTLDFLTQEMLREANTIASKCGDAEVSRAIVEVKGAIDRIKEQVQNVE